MENTATTYYDIMHRFYDTLTEDNTGVLHILQKGRMCGGVERPAVLYFAHPELLAETLCNIKSTLRCLEAHK